MKKYFPLALFLFFIGCKTGKKAPDVSSIPVTVHIERFDQAFFAIDTNHVQEAMLAVAKQYPYFINDFAVNILGTSPLSDTSADAFYACRRFISGYMPVKDSLDLKFRNMKPIEQGLRSGFQYIPHDLPGHYSE